MIFVVIALAICSLDFGVKYYIEKKRKYGEESTLFHGNIIVTKHHNTGAFLSVFQKKKGFVITVSSVLLAILFILFGWILPKKGHIAKKLGYSMVIGGAITNVYDRLKRGYVVDYFSFRKLKQVVFNLSDMFIFLGCLLLAIVTIRKGK